MATEKRKTARGASRGRSTGSRTAGRRTAQPSQSRAAHSRSSASRGETRQVAVRSKMTTDHGGIRRWAEQRGGHPACVRGTGSRQDTGMIRIDFPDGAEPRLQEISWDEWFQKFDEKQLALVYQDRTASGRPSRFNKLVSRAAEGRASRQGRGAPKVRTAGGG